MAACQPLILQLVEAVVARRRCLVAYQAPSRKKPNAFRYDPYRLLSIQGLLYCVGKVPVHGSLVTLAIDRIHDLTITEESFTTDPTFDLKLYEAEAFGVTWAKPVTVFATGGRRVSLPKVRVRLTGTAAFCSYLNPEKQSLVERYPVKSGPAVRGMTRGNTHE